MVQWLDNMFPTWLMSIFIIGGGALVTWLAVWIRHNRVKRDQVEADEQEAEAGKAKGDNDLTEVFVLLAMTLYGFLLAFFIFAVWSTYDEAQSAAAAEGGAISALARQSMAFPQADRQELLLALRAYSQSVIKDEWATMANSHLSPVTVRLFNHIFLVVDSLPDAGDRSDVVNELVNLSKARTTLITLSGAAIPNAYWFILIVGAVIAIGLSVMFSTETPRAHGLMAVTVAVVIFSCFMLVGELDYPLSGDTAFGPAAFQRALYNINSIQTGVYTNPPGS
jgi:hypothetical protein